MFDMKDLILEGIVYTIMGIVIVFAMLVTIMIVIKAMQLFSGAEKPKKQAPAPIEKTENVTFTPETTVQATNSDTELIAVITAAIASAMGKSSSGLVIRSYKKLSGSEWNKAGRREALDNRF